MSNFDKNYANLVFRESSSRLISQPRIEIGELCLYWERYRLAKPGYGRVCVYALCDENTILRYIGATTQPTQRFYAHLHSINGKEKLDARKKWLRSMIERSLLPTFRILEVCPARLCTEVEQRWIRQHAETVTNIAKDTRSWSAHKFSLRTVTDEQIKLFRRAAKDAGYKTWQEWLLAIGNRESSSY